MPFNVEVSALSVPYVEVSDDLSPGEGSFSNDDSQAVRVIDLIGDDPWSLVPKAVKEIVGNHRRDDSDSLVRVPPLRHPMYPWLHATHVTVKGLVQDTDVATIFDPDQPTEQTARFVRPRLTIRYQQLPYTPVWVKEEHVGDESRRYCVRLPQITTEAAQLERGTLVYAEGPVDDPNGNRVPFGTSRLLPKGTLSLVWYNVPNAYLMQTGRVSEGGAEGWPQNFYGNPDAPDAGNIFGAGAVPVVGGIGRVNLTTFMGFKPGTLLVRPPDIRPVNQASWYDANVPTVDDMRLWNVTILLDHFDPPLGASATTRGFNTTAYNKDGKYYKVTFPSGDLVFPTFDIRNLFLASGAAKLYPNS